MAYSLARAKDHTQNGTSAPEYSVYIYHHPSNHLEGWNDWEKRSVTKDLQAAMDEARALYESQKFEKVEIKEKRFDVRKDRSVDKTFKTYQECRASFDAKMLKVVLGCVFVLSGMLAVIKVIETFF